MAPKIIPPVYLIISLILIVANHFLTPAFNYISVPYNFAGLLLIIAGFSMVGKARGMFKKYNTPNTFDDNTSLMCEGIFKRTRNPMYLGMCLFLTGFAVCFQNVLSFIVPVLFFIVICTVFIPYEEKRLEVNFGEKYNDYRKLVRRWI